MDITYTMIGVDGLQYGPISLDQVKTWITEGRITPETKILRSDTNSWLPAANYTELGLATAASAAPPPPLSRTPVPLTPAPAPLPLNAGGDAFLRARVRSSGSWFYFIGAFSAINTIVLAQHVGFYFVLGLLGVNMLANNIVVELVAAGVIASFGIFASKGQTWAFIVGMALYALDGLVFLQSSFWLPLAFHVYALFRIGRGLKANLDLKAQRRA